MPSAAQIHRFPNGIRLATVEMPYMDSVGVGIWTEAGSRHERPVEHGMAHFVEHLLFKGTPHRSAAEISRQVERLGASLDAFTVEDHTCYHARCPAEGFLTLLDVMSDLYQHPVFDPRELESEKRVIREEIAMVRDQPSQLLEDLASEAAWGREHPLGRSITGTARSLQSFSRDRVFDFHKRCYRGRQTVIAVAGKIDHASAVDAVGERFSSMAAGASLEMEPAPKKGCGGVYEEMDDLEQCHLSVAFRAADRNDPDRFSQKILNVILGENMSSRLFQALREEQGLCYEVQSDTVCFADAGLLQIYLALDPDNLGRALHMVSSILDGLCEGAITAEEVSEAVAYAVGQSRLHLESVAAQVMWSGECLLSFDDWISPEEVYDRLSRVTPAAVVDSARRVILRGEMSLALIGPEEAIREVGAWAGTGRFNFGETG